MNEELDEYKKSLIQEYEMDDDIGDNIDSKNLEIKKNSLESQIKIQKEKNINKKELEKQRGKNNLEEKVKYLEEMNKIKISGLEQQNTIKINKLSEEYKYNFNIYVKEYQNKNDINMNLFSEKTLLNQKYDSTNQIIAQYSQELESQLEESKNSLKKEYELKYQKDLDNLKNNILINNNNEDSQNLSSEKKEMENEYYKELNIIKKENKENQNKIEEVIKNLIEKISKEFETIKTKEIKDINISLKDIKEKIVEINSNNDEEKGALIEDHLSDIISEKKVYTSKFNSLVKMNEEEFIKNKYLIQYYITIIKSVIQNLSINKKVINIDEIITCVNDIIKEYKMKYNNVQAEILFPVLNNAFSRILNNIFDDDKINNIIENSIYGKNSFLDNNTMNMTNIHLNSKFNETMNNFNNNQGNNNIRLLSSFSPKNNYFNNNNINNILNKTFSNNNNQRYILNNTNYNNNINKNKEESMINLNLNINDNNNIIIPELNSEFIEKLSPDNIQKYNFIREFFILESKKIMDELNIYNEKKDSEDKLNILFKSDEFHQYSNILNRIYEEENDKTNQYFRNINSKNKIFEILKKNCQDNFNFIEKYCDKKNIVDNKFNQIMNNIEEYKNNFYGNNNKLNNRNYFYKTGKKIRIENMMNNTFNMDYRNNYLNESGFVNTIYNRNNYNSNFFV